MTKLIYSLSFTLLNILILKGQPVITSLNPVAGAAGSTVVISGNNFNTTTSLNIVFFGATQAVVNNATANSLTVTVPLGANNFPLSVLNTGSSLTAYSKHAFQNSFFCPSVLTPSVLASMVSFTAGQNMGIAVGDFDGDGKSDMAACMTTGATTGTVSIFRSIATSGTISVSSFAAKQDYTVLNPNAIAVADINSDGKLDIITCAYSNSDVSILKNTSSPGTISFAAPYTFIVGGGSVKPLAIAIDDLDQDGKPEIVTADNFPGKVSVIKNNSTTGSLSFASSVEFTAVSQPYAVSLADIDGDGKKDIAVANSYTGFCVYRNTASGGTITAGSFAAAVDFTSSIGPFSIGTTDLDGDGKTDVVISGLSVGAIEIYRNTATSGIINTASFASPVSYTTNVGCLSLALADITGDGKAEIILPSNSSGSLVVLQNQSTSGSMNFSLSTAFSSSSGQKRSAVGDIDNDGRNDILLANLTTSVHVYRNLMGLGSAVSSVSVTCNGGADGQILLNALTQNTHSVLWSNAATSYTLANLTAGLYQYTISSGTCALTQSINIAQPAPINLLVTSSHTVLCEGETATITASGAGSYSWNPSASGPTITVSPATTTTYVVTGTLNGCTNTISFVQPASTFSLNVSTTTLLCTGETATLYATGAQNYTWTGVNVTPGVTVSPVVTTIYTVTGQNADGCLKTATLNLEVSECTGLKRNENPDLSFTVFPNPTQDIFFLDKYFSGKEITVEIYTTLGQKVYKTNISQERVSFSLGAYPKGIYIVKLSSGRITGYQKIIKE